MEDLCDLCHKNLSSGDTVLLTEKGSQGLMKAASIRGDQNLNVCSGQRVHVECRRLYTCPKRVGKKRKSIEKDDDRCTLRSGETVFTFREDCLFCGKSIEETKRQKSYKESYIVRTAEFQEEIYHKCKERDDKWGKIVMARIEYSRDLHASDSVYHQSCSIKFRTGKDIFDEESEPPKSKKCPGRQKNTKRETAFWKVIYYLEQNDDEQITVNNLIEQMKNNLADEDEPFSFPHMKTRLTEYFGEDLIFAEINGKANVVTFRSTVSKILHRFYSLPKTEDPEKEKERIIETAAKLIKNDIKSVPTSKDTYPSSGDISTPEKCINYIPDSLQLLLRSLFVGKDTIGKQAAIGHAIMQAVRPRVILAPLQLGLGIQFHHHFGSRFLVDTLSNLGFSCSYAEVQRYEYSAAVTNNIDIPGFIPGHFVQFVADNVDHNIRTIDGHDTFHGMGIIAAVTPGIKTPRIIPRLKVTTEDITEVGKIRLHFHSSANNHDLMYGSLPQNIAEDKTYNIDILWKSTWLLTPAKSSWNGTMQMVHNRGTYPGQSSVIFMPMIDLNPSDETCIFSTLHFVNDQAKRYNVTPVITFDQPLWWKALNIILSESNLSELRKIVLRLGGLHLEMSFLGCIGHIMSDSGLHELLETVYADNAVAHMFTGKAISRAIRGHSLVYTALQSLLADQVFHMDMCNRKEDEGSNDAREEVGLNTFDEGKEPSMSEHDVEGVIPDGETTSGDCDIINASKLFEQLLAGEVDIESICSNPIVTKIEEKLTRYGSELKKGRTAKLWLQYMEMIDILRQFIKAERIGDWKLHLQSVLDMLPYFAAAGHNLYAKSAYVYLMNMLDLETSNPRIYTFFMEGFHVVRRSDRYWAGLSTDLVIEQMLMRSLKTVGGLTRGRGMTETQRALWISSRPACSEINEAMQQATGTIYSTSEQHKESSKARRRRDVEDINILIDYLIDRNPLNSDSDLKSIASGVIASESNVDNAKEIGRNSDSDLKSIASGVIASESNVDNAKEIGRKVIDKMNGKSVKEFTFKKIDQVVMMNDKAGLKIDGEPIKIDPQLLFQRLVMAARGSLAEDLTSLFSYELCTFPPALFESTNLLREADKPHLADAMRVKVKPDSELPGNDMKYVIDGGGLLQWLPWPKGHNYGQLCEMYVEFIKSKYGQATVVFDGYQSGPSTKDNTHQRRTGGFIGTEVRFSETMVMMGKKKNFLANTRNKQRFINMLSGKLQEAGIGTLHASGDADLLIVTTAVQFASKETTALVGDDTDLLVLLCYYVQIDSFSIYFTPRPKGNSKKLTIWNIHETKQKLGESICSNLLFLHSILGCDTTSKVYGFGKGAILKYYEKSEKLQLAASIFAKKPTEITKQKIIEAGESALLCLYKDDNGKSLDNLRVSKFTEKVAKSSTFVDPKVLPPTSSAAKYHSLRVYFQIQEWKGNEENLDPSDWGWKIVHGSMKPIKTDKLPAPTSVLKIVRCTCKKGCKTASCSCKKVGLECTTACSTCKGVSCENSTQPELEIN